jgi:hypothetical protein
MQACRHADRQPEQQPITTALLSQCCMQCMAALTCGVDPHCVPHRLLLLLALERPLEDQLACRQNGGEGGGHSCEAVSGGPAVWQYAPVPAASLSRCSRSTWAELTGWERGWPTGSPGGYISVVSAVCMCSLLAR